MPHHPKPFFRADRRVWFVEIAKHQLILGKHPDGQALPAKQRGEWNPPREILDAYHRVMTERKKPTLEGQTVVAILDCFLDWCRQHRAGRTYLAYRERLQSFINSLKSKKLTVQEFKPFHVQEWVDSHPTWNPGMKRGRMQAVQRALNWAVKQGRVEKSPIAYMEKPPQGRRDQVITQDEYRTLLAAIEHTEFRDLVEAAWETGARPQELVIVGTRHFDAKRATWRLPPAEAKGHRWRVVYLNEAALGITRRLVLKWPDGPMFRNRDGNPWTPYAVNCAFRRVQRVLGRAKMNELGIPRSTHPDTRQRRKENDRLAGQHGPKYCLYTFRHTWATNALKSLDPVTVSVLMGHADTSMLARIYQHLAHDQEHLMNAVRRITPASA